MIIRKKAISTIKEPPFEEVGKINNSLICLKLPIKHPTIKGPTIEGRYICLKILPIHKEIANKKNIDKISSEVVAKLVKEGK
jgi:hypothetical protein